MMELIIKRSFMLDGRSGLRFCAHAKALPPLQLMTSKDSKASLLSLSLQNLCLEKNKAPLGFQGRFIE